MQTWKDLSDPGQHYLTFLSSLWIHCSVKLDLVGLSPSHTKKIYFNPIALRKAKILYNFGHSGCGRVKHLKVPKKMVKFANRVNLDEVAHQEPPT